MGSDTQPTLNGTDPNKHQQAPGAKPTVTPEMEAWLQRTVPESTPEDFGYDTTLWTGDLLAQ